ncbi:hypothetical protein [Caballeronia grimmiae]|uniref:hypothetical protein n=1 Tax=Caballeronia grimmiae TaxID=1071679 RepID=UPI0038B7D396
MGFSVDAGTIEFQHTRRGVNATATIVSEDGSPAGQINDVAEMIVADVMFVSADARVAFVAEARRVNPVVLGRTDHNDDIFASEYARALLAEAEQVLLARM